MIGRDTRGASAPQLCRNTARLTAVAALALLAGCAAPRAAAPPPPVPPAAWLDTAPLAPPPAAWDGAVDPALRALQARAQFANRDLALAALRWQQARALAGQAALRVQPSLDASASASRPLERGGTSQAFGASAGVAFEADLWGRLAQGEAALVAQAEAARTDIAAARVLLHAQVAERYWTAAAAQAQQALAREQQALGEEVAALTACRVDEGKLLRGEAERARSAALAEATRVHELAADAQLQRHQLAVLLDEPLPGPELAQARLPQAEPAAPAPGTPAEALARRPDVQRARLAVDAALARLRASEADRYPRLSFSAGVGTGGDALQRWFSQPLATLAAQLVVPLVDWRRLDLQREGVRSELDQAALQLRDTVARSLAEVEAQRIEQQRLQQLQQALQARLADLAESERVAQARHEAGSIGRLELLQARRSRLAGEQERVQLQLRRWLNGLALQRALALPLAAAAPASAPAPSP